HRRTRAAFAREDRRWWGEIEPQEAHVIDLIAAEDLRPTGPTALRHLPHVIRYAVADGPAAADVRPVVGDEQPSVRRESDAVGVPEARSVDLERSLGVGQIEAVDGRVRLLLTLNDLPGGCR